MSTIQIAYGQKRKADGQFLSSDDVKSGDDTGDDNDVVMEDSKSKQKKEPLLICGDRKRDVRNGNATILHCCDYNPVSVYLIEKNEYRDVERREERFHLAGRIYSTFFSV